MNRRWLAAAVLIGVLAIGGWFGWRAFDRREPPAATPLTSQAVPGLESSAPANSIETVSTGEDGLPTGGTPMAERVAIVGLLNKRNGVARDLTMKPGQALRVGDVIIRLRACEKTAPWETDTLTGAFVQVDARGIDRHWRRAFSGWLYKERPALNVVQHPVYDVWVKSCTMAWPATGPDTTSLSAPTRSSAKKSGAADEAPEADAEDQPTAPSSAADSNAT